MNHCSITLFVVCVTLICVTTVSGHSCGTVYDGLGAGQFDLNTQTSTSTIAAHWFGFDNDVLNYEWAIVSSALSPFLPGPGSCDQFRKTPDIHEWTNAHRSTDASISDLSLEIGETYFVLLRITNSDGKQVVTNSDGVLIVPKLATSSSFLPPSSSSSSSSSSPNQRTSRSVGAITDLSSSTCPIDAANRCTQSRKSVGTILQETYGDPVFNSESPVALLFLVGRLSDRARAGIFPDNGFTRQFQRDFEGIGLVGNTAEFGDALIPVVESSSDDDDGLAPGDAPAWVIAPIAVGIFLCGLLVFLFLLITRILRRDRESEPRGSGNSGTFVAGEDGSEKKGYAGRSNIGVANTSDRTDISFPDTAIRRLSITHNEDATEDLAEATRSPRRKHPIMQSTSSSFRDYRNT